MVIPEEFTPAGVARKSPRERQLYTDFLRCGEPWKSMFENNPELIPPDPKQPLAWGTGGYWDTTVGRKHAYWKSFELPQATRDLDRLRYDLKTWGFCLIEDGLSAEQCRIFHQRLLSQVAAERKAGVEMQTPSGQYCNTLVNKGACFVGCIEHDPAFVQAGPLIEQLMDETLGKGWICHSFLANGADPGGYPQGLHLDQGPMLPLQTIEAPALVNTMFIPQDVDDVNGGTLVIPGSHQAMIEAGSGGPVGKLPPAINLEAKAGTIMVFDGRLLHGTGVNRSDRQRFVATMSNVKPWMRQQENWVVSVSPEVLANASEKLRHRMGLQALTYGSTIEGFGLGATGRPGEPFGDIRIFREALDRGDYQRVGQLDESSTAEELGRDYTVKSASNRARQASKDRAT